MGIIDLDLCLATVNDMKDKQYLAEHPYAIWQGKNGCWYTYLIFDEKRRLIKRTSKEALEKQIVDYYKANDPANKPTFELIFNEWISSKLRYKEIKSSSALRYIDEYNRYIRNSNLEKIPVEDFSETILDEFIRSEIADKNLTAKAYSGLRTIVCGALKYAKRYKYTSFSPNIFFKDLDISRKSFKKPSSKRKEVYTKEEREKLYGYLRTTGKIEDLGLALMCLTGLRIGELAALKFEDNVGDCRLYVHRTEARAEVNGKVRWVVSDSPKMDHDEVIFIPKSAQLIINEAHMLTFKDEYLFSKAGNRITARVFRYRLKVVCEELGIKYKPPHQMRKTFASILLSSGVDEAIIKREMRHSDISTTRSYYQYITDKEDDEKSIIDKVMGI